MSPVESAYIQMLSVGLLWISVHCAGMCGPILVGFDVAGVSKGSGPARGAGNVLTYQGGRALTYMLLGALVGTFGAGIQHYIHQAGGYMSVTFGAALVGWVLWSFAGKRLASKAGTTAGPTAADRLIDGLRVVAAPILKAAGDNDTLRSMSLGALMGLLPCMISMWALGLAALTGSPLHGAAIMVLLVAMTTPMLVGVTILPRLVTQPLRRFAQVLPKVLMGVSGVWLILGGSAGLGLIRHAHFGFDAFGRHFAMMFW